MTAPARDARAGWAFAAPAAAALATVALWPLAATAWLSLRRVLPVFGEDHFVGLANYRFLVQDERFLVALRNTAYFTAVSVSLELALALPLALALHHVRRGRAVLFGAILVPWVLPTAVAAKLWAWLLNPEYGAVNRLLPGEGAHWLANPALALHAAILVDVWKMTPFAALLLLAGLQSIPEDVLRAARVDGAPPLRVFRAVTLPLLRPAILLVLLFRTLDAFRVFDVVFVLTEGGPANTTETLSLYATKTYLRAGNFGYGAALSLATFACVVALAAALLWRIGRGRAAEGAP